MNTTATPQKISPAKMKFILRLFLPLLLLSTLTHCSKFNCTRLEPVLGGETDLISFSYTIAEDLTQNAYPKLIPNQPGLVLLVTTFVDNNNLNKTSQFGRILQEHINSRLSQLGYTVQEVKLAANLEVEPKTGESMLTREIKKLSPSIKAQAVMVGTYSHINRTVYVSARFIDPQNKNIYSAKDYQLCMDDSIMAMLRLRRPDMGDEIQEPKRPFLNSILY